MRRRRRAEAYAGSSPCSPTANTSKTAVTMAKATGAVGPVDMIDNEKYPDRHVSGEENARTDSTSWVVLICPEDGAPGGGASDEGAADSGGCAGGHDSRTVEVFSVAVSV